MALPATYDFAGTGAMSADWESPQGGQAFTRSSDQGYSGSGLTAFDLWITDSFDADQYSQCVKKAGSYQGVMVRGTNVGNGMNAYVFMDFGGTWTLFKMVNGERGAAVATYSGTPTANDVIKITASGTSTTTVTCYINTVAQTAYVDSTSPHTSGAAGIYAYDSYLDDWEGGNLSGSGTTNVKTVQGLAIASVKTVQGLAIASVKTVQGLN